MDLKKHLASLVISLSTCAVVANAAQPSAHTPKHFPKIMVVMFENMSYAEIKDEPTFKKLVEYTGNSLDRNGRLVKLLKASPVRDTTGNGYAFFSSYFNNHSGGAAPSRPSQPNYIAMTSGSVHGIDDNETHDLDVDNLAIELTEAGVKWRVYAQGVPDPKASFARVRTQTDKTASDYSGIKPYALNRDKSEQENDEASHQYYSEQYKKLKLQSRDNLASGCFVGDTHADGGGDPSDGYKRKHEPFISYTNIQRNYEQCKNIVNGSHFEKDMNQMPDVAFYIPNQFNDGHNGSLAERVTRANAFLSKMMGTNPKTGEPLPDAAKAPFQQYMARGGLLVITFDEPSVEGNPDNSIYTVLAGRMINSGAYPSRTGDNSVICYPPASMQTKYHKDVNGDYEQEQCNHYNLLKLIEDNWRLRGLHEEHTSAGYKYAFALDYSVPGIWRG